MTASGTIKTLAMLALLAGALCAAPGCTGGACGGDCIDLSGTWKIIPGDDPAARGPAYDDSGAPEVRIPGDWKSFIKENGDLTATVWLRRKVRVGAEFAGKPLVLSLGRIAVADETYVNGRQVGGEGTFPRDGKGLGYGYAWQENREYFIPAGEMRHDRDNVVAVRVFSHVIGGVAGGVRITDFRRWSSYSVIDRLLSLLINEGALVLNFILIILFVITLDRRTQLMMIVYSILLLLSASCVHLLVLGVPEMDGLSRLKGVLVLIVLAHFIFLCGVQEFMNMRFRSVFIVTAAMMLGFAGVVLAAPDSRAVMRVGQPGSFALILVFSILFTGIFVRALYRDPLRYWVFVFAALPLVASSAYIARYVLTGRLYAMTTSIATHFPVVLTVMLVYLVLDFKSMRRENVSLARAVLRKNQAIHDLKKHAAEDGKAVPRERIYDVVEFLDANYMDAYDRRALARKFGFNEDYMLQLFKKNTGMTISQYINNRRIEAAKQLIAESDGKIIDIAYHVGFDNVTYFHRLFKNMTGQTPQEFRLARPGVDDRNGGGA